MEVTSVGKLIEPPAESSSVPRSPASTSGSPGRKPKRHASLGGRTMTPKQRKAVLEFVRDPARVRRSAAAYLDLLTKGELDAPR